METDRVFQICCRNECGTFTTSSFRIWNSSTGIPSPQLAFLIVMLPKAHLTWHSRMSGSRWVIIPSWLSGSWRSFLYSSSVQFFCVFFGEGNGTPLMYSCLENAMDRGAWWAAVHGVAKSWTWLSNFTFTCHFHALEKEMATHSSVLAWRIPGTGEPGGLPSMGSCRVGHDWSDLAVAVVCVFLPPLLNIFCFC